MKQLQIVVLCLAAMALPAPGYAQQKTRPDPVDPKIGVPPANYISPLQQYRPFADEPVAPWKASNDQVEKIGGWRVYAKEAQEPESKAEPAGLPSRQSAPAAKPPAHGGYSGHQMN